MQAHIAPLQNLLEVERLVQTTQAGRKQTVTQLALAPSRVSLLEALRQLVQMNVSVAQVKGLELYVKGTDSVLLAAATAGGNAARLTRTRSNMDESVTKSDAAFKELSLRDEEDGGTPAARWLELVSADHQHNKLFVWMVSECIYRWLYACP